MEMNLKKPPLNNFF